MCFEMAGSVISNGSASSLTVAAPSARRARIARRVELASAAKVSLSRSSSIAVVGVVHHCARWIECRQTEPRRYAREKRSSFDGHGSVESGGDLVTERLGREAIAARVASTHNGCDGAVGMTTSLVGDDDPLQRGDQAVTLGPG